MKGMTGILVIALLFVFVPMFIGSDNSVTGCNSNAKSASGVERTSVKVSTDAEGLTIEQKNIKQRLAEDTRIGSIKHLYIISAYSGQVIMYSTVQGKVTSSGKRLSPYTVSMESNRCGFDFEGLTTAEVLQDDGSYGSSIEYLYWWDTKGIYHQHYVSGGQIIHISNEPLVVREIIINMNLVK